MEIELAYVCKPIKGGIQAQAPKVGLTGHGESEETAVSSLLRAIQAWCSGLELVNGLENALDRRGIPWSAHGEGVSVRFANGLTGRKAPG